MTTVHMAVAGVPAPKGSMKCVARHADKQRARLVPDDPAGKLAPWRAEMVAAATRGVAELGGPVAGPREPVGVEILFVLPRPASVRREYPAARGADLDKLVRAVLDALQAGGVLADDAQVCRLITGKLYEGDGLEPGCIVSVYPLGDES